jgi:predicted RNase H-related nuclease YkuK (DUF458 family)
MSFIRAKEIPPRSGNWYDYEVKTVHEGSKVRQKVIRYIGKSVKRGSPVFDATLTPIEITKGESA